MSTGRSSSQAIRRLSAEDLPQLRSHMTRLGANGLRARFGYHVSDSVLDLYAESCVARNAVSYGYVEHGTIRGLGEMHLVANDSGRAGLDGELAFSIEASWRRRGIGTRLVRRLLLVARYRRVAGLFVHCAADNAAMLGLVRKYATDLTLEGDVVSGRVPVAGVDRFALPYVTRTGLLHADHHRRQCPSAHR